MNINSNFISKIELQLNTHIVSEKSVGGGCISDARIITTESGKKLFLKTHSGKPGMFNKEANGLKELSKADSIRIPSVVIADDNFLLLEYIEQGFKDNSFFKTFGQELASLHRYTSSEFGFFEDNYIGTTPQYNIAKGVEKTNWAEFYFQKRLLPQIKLAEKQNYSTKELSLCISKLENKLPDILAGSEEKPTLLHGDLWGGNYMVDNNNNAVLIDPAVYYGHRETDIAMTKMFGGFSQEFYDSYMEYFPLPDGWQYRENIYLLYHYMNHLNLFGNSYYDTTLRLAKNYF